MDSVEKPSVPKSESPEKMPKADQNETIKNMEQLKDDMAIEAAIKFAKAGIESAGKEVPKKLSGKVSRRDSPKFQEQIDFIKGHEEDNLLNAKMDAAVVECIVDLTDEETKQGLVVALDKRNELLGLAD